KLILAAAGKDQERTLSDEALKPLVDLLNPDAPNSLEKALQTLDRRGLGLAAVLQHAKGNVLPQYRVFLEGQEHWFTTAGEVEAFCQAEQARRSAEAVEQNGAATKEPVEVQELHEVKSITRGLEKLREFGLDTDSLLPPRPVAGQEPAPRFNLENDGQRKPLVSLRELTPAIRHVGEKGLSITRFKGLGEMNPDELWETTLDPAKRTLLRVQLDDAMKADELFRILMGDKVEPRREFMEKHAREVRNLAVSTGDRTP